ncbi:iron-containing redox enzyme family protein [Xenorhabdus sp. XENO-1]|uniref:iron-containing redox enzyme family protein n=1 Tax=Xenorhabdus bovienii TaxID=40576 RepID=UPI0020CA615D|nr:iron-containing redox enzyme family protein [Xenorhabdus bovienii]MCP9267336.1 iron-containing redox enzyme family protein [Xenorhabdus bovienii subsp. africana]
MNSIIKADIKESMANISTENTGNIWSDWLDEKELKKLTDHPVLQSFNDSTASEEMLKTFLIQHGYYSRHFTRYLIALISKLDVFEDIKDLLHNLLEEMGLEDENKITHAELFQRTLKTVGADINSQKPFENTTAMVDAMFSFCLSDDPLEGLSAMCLGAEAIVPLIYKPVLNRLMTLNYNKDATEFFTLHIEEDEDHAIKMFEIIDRLTSQDESLRLKAINIGSEMIRNRVKMLDSVWESEVVRKNNAEKADLNNQKNDLSFHSADFWRVNYKPTPSIPEKLIHKDVINSNSHGENQFSAERKHKVNIVNLPTKTISMTLGHLDAEQSTNLHRHNYETVIYIIEGNGVSKIGNNDVAWSAGDAIYIPAWVEHKHSNMGQDKCLYIACENAPLLQNIGNIALREELE